MPAQILLRELVVQVVAVERLRRFAHGFSTEAPTQRSVVEDRSLRVLVTTEQARVSGKSPIPQDTCSATSRTELAGRKKKKKAETRRRVVRANAQWLQQAARMGEGSGAVAEVTTTNCCRTTAMVRGKTAIVCAVGPSTTATPATDHSKNVSCYSFRANSDFHEVSFQRQGVEASAPAPHNKHSPRTTMNAVPASPSPSSNTTTNQPTNQHNGSNAMQWRATTNGRQRNDEGTTKERQRNDEGTTKERRRNDKGKTTERRTTNEQRMNK